MPILTNLLAYLCCDVDELDEAAGTPTVPNTITMRVRSTLSLQCSLQSASSDADDYYVEWSKDDEQMSQSRKYVFTTDGATSGLAVSNTGQSPSCRRPSGLHCRPAVHGCFLLALPAQKV